MYACMTEEGITPRYRWLWATMWLLWIEFRTSGRAAIALNRWAISPALVSAFWMKDRWSVLQASWGLEQKHRTFSLCCSLLYLHGYMNPYSLLRCSSPKRSSFVVVFFFFFRDRVSLCSPGCPGIHFVDQAGLELRNQPASASQELGLKACATTPGFFFFLRFIYYYT